MKETIKENYLKARRDFLIAAKKQNPAWYNISIYDPIWDSYAPIHDAYAQYLLRSSKN